MIKPPALKKGDTIAIISPSSGLSHLFPHRIEVAKAFFEKEGFAVKLFPTTNFFVDGNAGTPEERAKDIHDAFLDKDVRAIICSIGGLACNELLSLIDYGLIKKNPKIFCGYSDISILHYAFIKKADLVTFYGPSAMVEFGESPEPLKFTVEHFFKAVTGAAPIGKIKASKRWTDEVLDWSTKEDLKRPRALKENKGHLWLKKGKASAPLVGGCLPSILQLSGTQHDMDYTENILFIEIPEGEDFRKGTPLHEVDSQLAEMSDAGVFHKIKGLIIGRGYGYTEEQHKKLIETIKKRTEPFDFPILCNVDIGHTSPMITVPLGVRITLDSEKDVFSVDESGVR